MKDTQKIIKLEANGILRLSAVQIRADGKSVVIGGANDQGKSSVLTAIEMAFGGGKAMPPDPIRHGDKSGKIVVETDDYIVTKTVTEGGSSLVVTGRDGSKFTGAQTLLNELYGSLTFDPLAFTKMKPKDQRDALAVLVGVDTREIDNRIMELVEERKAHKRDVQSHEGDLDRLPLLTDAHRAAPDAEQSAAELSKEIAAAHAFNADNRKQRDDVEEMKREGQRKASAVDTRKARIAELEAELQTYREALEAQEKDLATFRDGYMETKALAADLVDKDVAPLNTRMSEIEATNRLVRDNQARAKAEEELAKLKGKVGAATKLIEAEETKKTELLAAAKFPVKGLSLTDDYVTFETVPLSQISSGKLTRISVRIAAAQNNTLKVALVREGSLLDEKSMENLCREAEEIGLQLWIETCNRLHPATVVIEDGMVQK